MSRYECLNCHRVFCGWSVRYKLKYKCPVCGGELREVYPDNKESRKAERYHKGDPEDSLYRPLKAVIQAIRGLF